MKSIKDNSGTGKQGNGEALDRRWSVFIGVGPLFCFSGFIDLVGAVAAVRHCRNIVVTASMDHLDFVAPVHVGDLLILKASVNRAFRTSMEVGVRAMVEDARAGTLRHVSSAYLTYVAVDSEGNRVPVPCVIAETEHQKRRFADAARRREMRGEETLRKKEIRALQGTGWHV
jgi:acyl-CoA hydrolase